jgi:hypothetical protein
MLHSVDSRGWTANTAWCVPTAISFLSGIPLIHSHSRAAFIQEKSLKEVKGVYSSEAVMLLREQGYRAKPINLEERYTTAPKLNKFLKDRTSYEKCMPMMIQVEKAPDFCHMICCHYDYAADNWTMKPVPITKFPHRTKFVTLAWIIEKGL